MYAMYCLFLELELEGAFVDDGIMASLLDYSS